jgi:alpha-tubulin suppressor-like RCC1 family protein
MKSSQHAALPSGFLMAVAILTPSALSAQTTSLLGTVSTQVVAGASHTCALTPAGAVECWGANDAGQLGVDGSSITSSDEPVAVTNLDGMATSVVMIAAGAHHNCALTTTGTVKCWGDDSAGQLGNGSTGGTSYTPVGVSGLVGVVAIAAGGAHACALTTAGAVKCWGDNGSGELGVDSTVTTSSDTPVDVGGLSGGVSAIAAGANHTCAVRRFGPVVCWGDNFYGQLGVDSGTIASSDTPLAVAGTAGMAAIAAGQSHTCALAKAGSVRCWGDNGAGQLGDGSTGGISDTPVSVTGLSGVAAISAGAMHTCAVTNAGAARCWGDNTAGQLGGGSSGGDSGTPVPVGGLPGAASIAAGGGHTCALATIGAVDCWGDNDNGQLGVDDTVTTASPAPLPVYRHSAGAAALAAGSRHACAVATTGNVYCWGNNDYLQLGRSSGDSQPAPVSGVGGTGYLRRAGAIFSAEKYTCVLNAADGLTCWGAVIFSSSLPTDVAGLPAGIAAMSGGTLSACALTNVGNVYCWGSNNQAQLGDGNYLNSSATPVQVLAPGGNAGPLGSVIAIGSGAYHTCAVTAANTVLCWGNDGDGQLGSDSADCPDNATKNYQGKYCDLPLAVSGLTGISAVTAGQANSCALGTGGTVACWGLNNAGQLGNGSIGGSSTAPVAVTGLANVTAISEAPPANTVCALTAGGAVECWGEGISTNNNGTPALVVGLSSGVAAIATGKAFACALTSAGGVLCWGADTYGQLGDGMAVASTVTPVPVRAGQSIAFAPPPSIGNLGTVLSATASNGGSVTFDTWTPSTCSVSGSTVTVLQPEALCGIRASQAGGARAGGGSDAAAPQQLRTLWISNTIFRDGFEY